MPTEDPRPGLTEWLTTHWPPALVASAYWLKSLVAHHKCLFGEDGFTSDCLLAAVEAWDLWEPERGEFRKFFMTRAKSTLRNAVNAEYREKRDIRRTTGVHPGISDRKADRAEVEIELADLVRFVLENKTIYTDTFLAVLQTETPKRAAARLGITPQGLHRRLMTVRRHLADPT